MIGANATDDAMDDELLHRLEELRVWQENQQHSAGQPQQQLSDEQILLMQQLGISFNNTTTTSAVVDDAGSCCEDDEFFENIERQIQVLRSGNTSMRSQNLDDTPVMSRKDMDFEATPLKAIDLNQFNMDDNQVRVLLIKTLKSRS